jgi:hypothetical protein
MGLAFPIVCSLVALESLVIAVTLAGSWMKGRGTVIERRRRWLRCLVITSLLAILPTILAAVEIVGDLATGIGTTRPLVLLIVAIVFPAFALLQLRASR